MSTEDDALEMQMAGAQAAFGRVLESVAGLADDACRQPSLLPGWSRGHVLTHLASSDGSAGLPLLTPWA